MKGGFLSRSDKGKLQNVIVWGIGKGALNKFA